MHAYLSAGVFWICCVESIFAQKPVIDTSVLVIGQEKTGLELSKDGNYIAYDNRLPIKSANYFIIYKQQMKSSLANVKFCKILQDSRRLVFQR